MLIQNKSGCSVDELCDYYLTNSYLYCSQIMASKSLRRSAEWQIIDHEFLEAVESTIDGVTLYGVNGSNAFRKTIIGDAENIELKFAGKCKFGIDSNPILGKAIRLYFDKVNRKKKITYRSIYDKWEPTCYQLD